jgi:hypothetical protein
MQLDAKRNFFTFFSGYLHLPLTAPRLHIDIDDFYGPRGAEEDPDGPPRPPTPAAEPDELAVGRSPLPPELLPDPWDLLDLSAAVRPIAPFVARLPTLPIKPLPPDPVTYSHGGGGGDSPLSAKQTVVLRQSQITVDYKDGGNPLDLRVDQVNTLRDNDIAITLHNNNLDDNDVVIDADAESVAWPDHDIMPIAELAQMAEPHVPDAYAGATATPESVVAALRALGDSPDQPATLHEGVTIDGAAVGADAPLPPSPADLVPARPVDSDANMAVVETGANRSENFAAVIDEQGAIGTMIVLGDSHRSNAIVQTNVLVDHTAVDGTAEQATLQTGGNQANNIAEFIQTLEQNPYEMGFFGGMRWHVDRVNGDYYDVNLIRQLNVMQDNDMVQQTAADHYKFWEIGANGQDNVSIVEHSGKQYDLVIVTGDYFGANWIFQTNVLLNSDYVLINAGPGGAGSEIVSTGANWLLNAATLVDYSGAAHELTPDMQALVAALQNGEATLDLANGFVLPGDGSGTMNVLFITGNYYDINVLEQTNIMSDSDVVLQTLENGEAGYVATGGNELANEALLVTLGPLGGQYVGGTEYAEATLVQTNIIAQSADVAPSQSTVVLGDPAKLASEAAALIVHGPTPPPPQPEESAAPPPADSGSHTTADPLSSVLS